MADYRNARGLLLITVLIACSMAQDAARQGRQTGGVIQVPQVPLKEVSTVPIPSLPAESIVMLVFCQADGVILFRLAMPNTGVQDPVAVSSDGKTVVRFGRWKINDITDPVPISVFPSGSDVYFVARQHSPRAQKQVAHSKRQGGKSASGTRWHIHRTLWTELAFVS
jgi:hypothetical protein